MLAAESSVAIAACVCPVEMLQRVAVVWSYAFVCFRCLFALLDVFVSDSAMFGIYIVQCETHRGVGILILSSRGNCVQLLYVMCFQTCFRGKCGYKVT